MDPSAWQFLSIDPLTKTYLSFGLVILALFEFYSAMKLFGIKGPHANAALLMKLHRLLGYVFLVYFAWISWICLEMMSRLARAGNYALDARSAEHGLLALILFAILFLKIAIVRIYRNYRPYVPLLGIILALGTIVLWFFAGWLFLFLVEGTQTVTALF